MSVYKALANVPYSSECNSCVSGIDQASFATGCTTGQGCDLNCAPCPSNCASCTSQAKTCQTNEVGGEGPVEQVDLCPSALGLELVGRVGRAATCTGNCQSQCVSCNAGFYLNNNVCSACPVCVVANSQPCQTAKQNTCVCLAGTTGSQCQLSKEISCSDHASSIAVSTAQVPRPLALSFSLPHTCTLDVQSTYLSTLVLPALSASCFAGDITSSPGVHICSWLRSCVDRCRHRRHVHWQRCWKHCAHWSSRGFVHGAHPPF